MERYPLLDSHIGSFEDGVKLINKMYWNLSIAEKSGQWFVRRGEKVIFSAPSREFVDAFLYGMALAYSVLPETIVQRFQQDYKPD